MAEKMKPCQVCGKMIAYVHNKKKYCPECAYDIRKQQTVDRRLMQATGKEREQAKKAKEADKKLARITLDAKQSGLSYGQYMARRHGGFI